MKIPFTNINLNISSASKNTPNMSDILTVINELYSQIHRSPQEISDFKEATEQAESVYNPNRYLLYKLYNDVVLDSHLTAAIQQRKNLTLSREFKVIKKDGNEDEEMTKLLQTKWFYEFVDLSLDSLFWGHSLVQFEDLLNNSFKCVTLVHRLFVKPEKHIVVKNWSDINGVDYLEPPYSDWCIGVGKPKDLGLLHKASPLVVWKKNAMGAWSDYQNKFGLPPVIGKTDATDKKTQDKFDDMLQNMQRGAWGRFGKNDMIELLQTKNTDAYMVFDQLIERCNTEISKLILGQTGTISEKSFVGSAEVHERVLSNYAENDLHFIESVLNYQLVPMMEKLGVKFNGSKIIVDESEELAPQEQIKIDEVLLKNYDIDPEQIMESYGRDVTVKAQPEPFGGIKNQLDDLYN